MKEIINIKILAILLSGLFFMSCEKVIDVDLKDAIPRMVIEGNITSDAGPYVVSLSKSGSYFDYNSLERVPGAVVTITDENGTAEILNEVSPGIYQTENLQGIENTNYSIQVISEGETYIAEEYLPVKVDIDTIYYMKDEPGSFGSEDGEETYSIFCVFSDPIETADYYRFKIYINGLLEEAGFGTYLVVDDELFNGITFILQFRGREVVPGDTVRLELQTTGYNTYKYFSTLNDALNGGGMGSTPYNPITNMDNGALGYFGAYNTSAKEILIQ